MIIIIITTTGALAIMIIMMIISIMLIILDTAGARNDVSIATHQPWRTDEIRQISAVSPKHQLTSDSDHPNSHQFCSFSFLTRDVIPVKCNDKLTEDLLVFLTS